MASDDILFTVVRTKYATGISIEVPGHGKLFAGHVAPVHKEPLGCSEITAIFASHDILLGDFNASTFHLERAGVLGQEVFDIYNPPSYLPSIKVPRGRIFIPSFDLICCKRGGVQRRSGTGLPKFLMNADPRSLMAQRGYCSDHALVQAEVVVATPAIQSSGNTIVHDNSTRTALRCATWNIADPHFWARFYEGADAGFSADKEAQRLAALLKQLSKHLHPSRCDVLALQEVPAGLVEALEGCASDHFLCKKVQMHCGFGEFEDCSNVMLFVEKSLVVQI